MVFCLQLTETSPMRSNFNASYALTRKDEGGNVDDKADRGGRTSRGVTQRVYDSYRKSKGAPLCDVYLMTEDECQDIYRMQYWSPTNCDLLCVGPDYAAFDYSVNSGPARGKAAGDAVRNIPPIDGVKAICAKRTSFVNAIRNFSKFRKGVLARVARVEAAGVKMAMAATPVITPKAVQTKVLSEHSNQAKTKAKKASSKATASSVGFAAVPAGSAPVLTTSLDWRVWVFAAIGLVIMGLLLAYFAYQHTRHAARADAYSDASKEV